MARVKPSDLERQVNRINSLMGIGTNPTTNYYKVEYAYGKQRLVQVLVDLGNSVLPLSEYLTKKELHLFMTGIITGLTLPL